MSSIVQRTNFPNTIAGTPGSFVMNFTAPVTPGNTVIVIAAARLQLQLLDTYVNGGGETLVDVDATQSLLPFGAGPTVDMRWVQNTVGGYTSITVTTGVQAVMWGYEISPSQTEDSVAAQFPPSNNDPPGIGGFSISNSNANAFYVSVISMDMGAGDGGIVSGVDSPWTLDSVFGGLTTYSWAPHFTFAAAYMIGTGTQTTNFHVTTAPDFSNHIAMASASFDGNATFCGGMASQVVGQPTIKGRAKRVLG